MRLCEAEMVRCVRFEPGPQQYSLHRRDRLDGFEEFWEVETGWHLRTLQQTYASVNVIRTTTVLKDCEDPELVRVGRHYNFEVSGAHELVESDESDRGF